MLTIVSSENVDTGIGHAELTREEGSLEKHGCFVNEFLISTEVGISLAKVVIGI